MADAKTPPADAKETAVALKGLAPSMNEAALTTTVGAHGKLLRVKLDGLGGAHVVFASTRAAQRAAAALNGAVVQGQQISAQHVRTFAKTTRPCRGFLEGKCRKGDQCKYWHAPDASGANGNGHARPTAVAVTAPPVITTPKTTSKSVPAPAVAGDDISGIPKASICRNFAKGSCVHGEQCRFAHVLGAGALPPPAPASIPAQCSFYAAGRCTKGDECAFLHTDRPPQPPASKPTLCSYFAAGRCARGDQCAYLHEETKPVAAKTKTKATIAPVAVKQQSVATPVAVKPVPVKKAKTGAPVPTVTTMAQGDGDRTCIECEKPDVAMWVCAGCDNAKYCDECKPLVHRPKVMRAHTPEPLPTLPSRVVCGECETQPAKVQCTECDVPYCESCDASVHQFKSLRNHTRTPLATTVVAPSLKKEKKATKVTVVPAVAKPVTAYVESVPQYDLPSDPESSDEEDEVAVPVQAAQKPQRLVPQPAVADASSESDDEEESPAAAAMRAVTAASAGYVESVPKYELSSDSESSDDDDSVEAVKQSIVKSAVVAVKQKILSPVKSIMRKQSMSSESSDSDDDDFEDERPVVAKPTTKAPTAKAPLMTLSSESESDVDSDKETSKPNGKAAPTPKRKASVSSESSSGSDSSDDEDARAPPAKQPRVAAKAPVVPVAKARPAAPTQVRQAGISTGSSHSLVKTIEAYAESDNTEVLHLDPNLNGFERLLAHDCAERLGLEHVSVGEGLERHITVGRKGGKRSGAPGAGVVAGGKKQKRA